MLLEALLHGGVGDGSHPRREVADEGLEVARPEDDMGAARRQHHQVRGAARDDVRARAVRELKLPHIEVAEVLSPRSSIASRTRC